MAIRFFDMFAGIGGFRSGLEAVGGFQCVGYCEIDKYVRQAYEAMYDTKGEVYFDDARNIEPEKLPDIDLICGGFPCQSFSIAGKRGGFDDARGTLFFEIARIAAVKRPSYLLLENVPGLLSHDGGRTFATILSTLCDLGYNVAWQVLNSANFGVAQSRKRVFIVGFLGERCAGEILSFTETNGTSLIQSIPGTQGNRVYSTEGLSCTLTSGAGGFGGKSGLYDVGLPTSGNTQGLFFIDMNENPKLTQNARCITTRQDAGIGHRKGEHSGVFIEETRAILTPDREKVRQQGRRIKEPDEPMFTITAQDRHGVVRYGKVRKLMPIECWRLQGFSDEQFYKAQETGLSDARLYKMAGNAVTVPVISALGKLILEINAKYGVVK